MSYAYFNGRVLPMDQAHIPLNDIGILRGYGLCDVARTRGRIPFHLERNLERLRTGAAVMRINIPYSNAQLTAAVTELVERNTVTGEASIKFIVTGGPSLTGTTFDPETPTVFILVSDFTPLPEHYFTDGVSLLTYPHQRYHPEIKSINYQVMVEHQPLRDEANAFELLYHADGELREAATSNIFVVHDNVISTPHEHVLAGITRSLVLELASKTYAVATRTVLLGELKSADEIFLTATNKDILPVVRIDDTLVGNGRPGPISQSLLTSFRIN